MGKGRKGVGGYVYITYVLLRLESISQITSLFIYKYCKHTMKFVVSDS